MTLTFTEDGRKNVIDTSELLKDDITDNQVICLSFKMLLTIYFERRCEESKNDQETAEAPPQKRLSKK